MVELNEPLATLWRGKDAFEVKHLQGEVFRELETRRTLRFELAGGSYFSEMAPWHLPQRDRQKPDFTADAGAGRRSGMECDSPPT